MAEHRLSLLHTADVLAAVAKARAAPSPAAEAPPGTSQRWLDAALIVALVALANAALLAPLPLEIRLVGALVLFVILPGHLLVEAVFARSQPQSLERWVLALGSGYASAILLALLLHVPFRPIHTAHVLAGADLLNAGLLTCAVLRRAKLRPGLARPSWATAGWLLLLLVLAAPLRLATLGYSDFQGDEAKVVLRTMAVLQGVPDALIAHRRPAGEILLNTIFLGGLGAVTEQSVRLPFALAGVAAVLAFYRLGWVLFNASTGLVAALLLAVTGYFVAFGRILQYVSASLLLDVLAVLCLFRFARGSRPQGGYALVGGLLLAAAGLTAYSAVLLLPVAALALWPRMFGVDRAAPRDLAAWLWPLAVLLPGVLLVYVLLPLGSGDSLTAASTFSMYVEHRLGANRPYFNLERFLYSVSHYNSSPYLLFVLGIGLLAVLGALGDAIRDLARQGNPAPTVQRLGFAWLGLDVRNLAAALLFVAAVGLLVGSARRSLSWRLALVWLAGPLFVHLFVVQQVGTHWREALPGLLLLVAAAAVRLYARLPDQLTRRAALVAGALFLAANAHYVYVAWIQPWPEYQLMYPRYRHRLDWSGAESARAGSILGATRHHGWKALGELIAQGELPSEYATNDRAEAAWYLKTTRLCPEAAKLYIRPPTSPRERQQMEAGEALPGFFLGGWVYVDSRPALALLVREPPADGPRIYRAEDYEVLFDRERAWPWAPVGQLYRPLVNAVPECPAPAN